MGSAGSSLKGGDIDGISQWTSQLYFDPEAVKSSGPTYWIEHGELRTKLKELVDPTEKILRVEIYRHPLSSVQITSYLFFHAFVVFQTKGFWWSIEKNVGLVSPAILYNIF